MANTTPITRQSGVTVIELAMVLTIIGIIVGSAIIAGMGQTDIAKDTQTRTKLDTIERALTAFVALNGRLPCPGDAALTYTSAGSENCTGTMPSPASTVIIGGSVPVTALLLPAEFMLDGWGNKFTYAVTVNFTTTANFRATAAGGLTVQDATSAARTTQAAMVLISHGPNGLGAYSQGTTQNAQSTNDELKNGQTPGNWNGVFVQKEIATGFDDIVRYKMKWQLVREAGAVINDATCDTAKTVLNTGAASTTYCNVAQPTMDPNCAVYLSRLANKVNELCLQQ